MGRELSPEERANIEVGIRRFDRIGERYGLNAVVTLDIRSGSAFGGEGTASWSAEVLRVSDQVDAETRAIGIIIAVRDPYGQAQRGQRPALLNGSFVRVELFADPILGLTPAPRAALRDGPSGAAEVLVATTDNVLARREVELVATIGDLAAIGGGLEPGDRIVITDLAPALIGEPLNPVVDEEATARLRAAGAPSLEAAEAPETTQ